MGQAIHMKFAFFFGPFLEGLLKYFEIVQDFTQIIKIVQREYFNNEIKNLERAQNVDSNSWLSFLNLFLDGQNIIRVVVRLQNSNLSFK